MLRLLKEGIELTDTASQEEKKEVIPIQDNDDDDRQVLSADKK